MGQLDAAVGAQEAYMGSHREAVEELEKVRALLAEQQDQLGLGAEQGQNIAEQLAELEILKRQMQVDAERKKKNKENARKNLEKSLLAGDMGILRTVFGAWFNLAQNLKMQKAKKDQNTAVAMRGIANTNNAIMDFCITAWYKILEEKKMDAIEAARRELEEKGDGGAGSKRSRQKALAQLEKQLGNKENGLLREVIAGWAHVKVERLRKEKAKAMAYRTVAGSTQALVTQIYQGWSLVWEESKKKREKKASGNARAMRMIANGNNAMMDFCLTQWAQITKKSLAMKRSKDDGHTRALKMMAGTQNALQMMVIQTWAEYIKKNKDKSKKLRAVERNLVSGDSQLLQMIFGVWKTWQEAEHKKKKSKIGRMQVAEKAIAGHNGALLLQVFKAWDRFHDEALFHRKKEELENTKGCYDQVGLEMSQKEVDALRKETEEWRAKHKEMIKNIDAAESKLNEKLQALQLREMDLSKIKRELDDSRKKAKDINEELAKVGQFLAQTPRRKQSPSRDRKSQESKGDQLPAIDGTKSRPRSGARGRNSGDSKSGGPVPAPQTGTVGTGKTAWAE